MANKQEFDADAFYAAVERAVRTREVSWKEVSQQTGISQTTLTRMGQGRRPDAAGLATLSAWAGLNPADYVSSSVPRCSGAQTLDRVALLFRQDSTLDDSARSILESIVENTYYALSKKG